MPKTAARGGGAGPAAEAEAAGSTAQPAAETSAAAPQRKERVRMLDAHLRSRPYVPQDADDGLRSPRSYTLPAGVVERAKATAIAIQSEAYAAEKKGKVVVGEVPDSYSAYVEQAIEAANTYYENLFNDGESFDRVHRLSPGPSRTGAQRGAALRASQRAAQQGDATSAGEGAGE